MKRINIYLLFVFLTFMLPLNAQQNQGAKTILDKTASVFKNSKGIQTDFDLIYFTKGHSSQKKMKGRLQMKGNCFILKTENTTTWFDGKTQWSYLSTSGEVNISNPSADELQKLNPYYFLEIYNYGYNYAYNGTTNYKGKSAYEIVLTAKNSSSDLQKVLLVISKSYEPLYIKTEQKDKTQNEIFITDYQTSLNYPNNLFKFDKKKYPDVEIIDLR